MKFILVFLLTIFTLTLSAQEKVYKHTGYDTFDRPIISYKEYSLDGNLIQEGEYINGEPNGIWKMYRSNGEISSVMKFQYGNRVWLKTNHKGRKIIVYYENNLAYKSVAYLRSKEGH